MDDVRFLHELDRRFRTDAPRLSEWVGLSPVQAQDLCATIHAEVSGQRKRLLLAWPNDVPMKIRLTIVERYHLWTTLEKVVPNADGLPPDQVEAATFAAEFIVHFYMSFVYLTDGLFSVLKEKLPEESVTRACATFIRDPKQRLRHLRNAVSHGRWSLEPPDQLKFWDGPQGAHLKEYTCSKDELEFYSRLITRTGWPALVALAG